MVEYNSKIRVMHILHQLSVGGTENGVVNIVNNHDYTIFEPTICTLTKGGVLANKIDRTKVKIIELNKQKGNDIGIPIQLWKIFKREKPHIVHTHAWGTLCEGVIAAKLAGVPIIVHGEHGTIELRKRNVWAQKLLWRATDQVLSVSEILRRELSMEIGFPVKKIQTIINGVDLQKFSVASNNTRLKTSFVTSPDDVVVGTVGRLVSVKDYNTFLKALKILLETNQKVKAIIVGDGPLNEELRNLAKELNIHNNVVFLGNRNDVPDLLNIMDIFVLTSLHEGISNTILEAMACGLPVVATNVGGTPEIVDDGETGLLVEAQNSEQLAKAIKMLMQNVTLRKRMGKMARKKVEKNLNLKNMVSEYEKLYLLLIRKKGVKYFPCVEFAV